MYHKLIIFTDGGARGNPGPAGIGVVIKSSNYKIIKLYGRYIGIATNNEAEYQAVISALEEAKKMGAEELAFYLDSELLVKQLNREYRVKDAELASLFLKIWNLGVSFKKISYRHIFREKNTEADKLVNKAIDENT